MSAFTRWQNGLVAAIGLAGLALAGCGNKNEGGDKPATGTPATEAAAQAQAPASAAPADGFAALLDGAAGCVAEGRLNRSCEGYVKLSRELAQKPDKDAVAKVVVAAESPEANKKLVALSLLARTYPEEGEVAAKLLPRLDQETDANVQVELLRALAPRTGAGVEEKALALLGEGKEPAVRAAAARVLSHEAHAGFAAQSAPKLLEALEKDSAPAVRRQAATGLGNLKHEAAIEPLIKSLDDELVAPAATFALARFESPAAYDAIWKRIEDGAKTGKVSLSLLASVKLLEKHPKHDATKELKTLEKIKAQLAKTAGADQQSQAALRLVERSIERLKGGGDATKPVAVGAPASQAAPVSAGGATKKAP